MAIRNDDPAANALPRVVATGRGGFARQILEVAHAHGVKVREDADLVELLAALDVDNEIPLPALAAVAEILSYVYQANGEASAPDLGGEGAATT